MVQPVPENVLLWCRAGKIRHCLAVLVGKGSINRASLQALILFFHLFTWARATRVLPVPISEVNGTQHYSVSSCSNYLTTKSNTSTMFLHSASLCLSVSVYGVSCGLLSVSRLYYHSLEVKGSLTTYYLLLSSISPLFLPMSLCPVFEPFEPFPVTVNLRQPLCWHRWEVNRSQWPILQATLPSPSVSQVRAEY